ncbi:MAG: hypothetical protein ACJ73D_10250 [Pyrinomonadaceae bacterium]
MRPSIKWFPLSLTERAAWYRNFNAQIQQYGADLGLTAGEMASVQADCDMLTFLATSSMSLQAYFEAFQAFRRELCDGRAGDTTPQLPTAPALVAPASIEPGIFGRLTSLVPRIRTSPNFNEQMESTFGIAPTRYRPKLTHLEDNASPAIKASAEPGHIIAVKFVRGASNGVDLEMRLDNEEDWQPTGKFLKSPGKIEIPHNTEHLPRRVQLRARFLNGNDPVGNWSDVVTVPTVV